MTCSFTCFFCLLLSSFFFYLLLCVGSGGTIEMLPVLLVFRVCLHTPHMDTPTHRESIRLTSSSPLVSTDHRLAIIIRGGHPTNQNTHIYYCSKCAVGWSVGWSRLLRVCLCVSVWRERFKSSRKIISIQMYVLWMMCAHIKRSRRRALTRLSQNIYICICVCDDEFFF